MIQYIDRPDIPAPIRKALASEYYGEGLNEHFDSLPKEVRDRYRECNFSTTTLIRAPRQRVLFNRHSHQIILDPMGGFWRMLGHVKHSILEMYKSPTDIVEYRAGVGLGPHNRPGLLKGLRRNGAPIKTAYIHGQGDRYLTEPDGPTPARTLQDWKFTSAFSVKRGANDEHIAQLNILAWMYHMNGIPVEHIQNVYLFRDWAGKMVREGSYYPSEQILVVEQPLWHFAETEEYINQRLRLHLESDQMEDDQIPYCTDSELWRREPSYQAFKKDNATGGLAMSKSDPSKPMKRKFASESRSEVEEWIKDPTNRVDGKGKSLHYEIITKPAVAARCSICEVKEWCSQHRAEQAAFGAQEDDEES